MDKVRVWLIGGSNEVNPDDLARARVTRTARCAPSAPPGAAQSPGRRRDGEMYTWVARRPLRCVR